MQTYSFKVSSEMRVAVVETGPATPLDFCVECVMKPKDYVVIYPPIADPSVVARMLTIYSANSARDSILLRHVGSTLDESSTTIQLLPGLYRVGLFYIDEDGLFGNEVSKPVRVDAVPIPDNFDITPAFD